MLSSIDPFLQSDYVILVSQLRRAQDEISLIRNEKQIFHSAGSFKSLRIT